MKKQVLLYATLAVLGTGCGSQGPSSEDVAGIQLLLGTDLMVIQTEASTLCSDQKGGAMLNFTPYRDALVAYGDTWRRGNRDGVKFDLPAVPALAAGVGEISTSADWCATADALKALGP